MRAMQFHGDRSARPIDPPVPEPAAGEALLRIDRVGICGSDIAIYTGKNKRAKYPVIPGHEFVGTIERLGPDAACSRLNVGARRKVGDRVMVVPTITCGHCPQCLGGQRHICSEVKFLGIQFEGGFAEYALAPVANLLAIPDALDFKTAVLAEPLGVGIHALSLCNPGFNDAVLVLGAGPIGMISAMLARDSGCRVVMADPSPLRRAQAKEFGFETFDNSELAPADAVGAYTKGLGFDVFFECAGHPSTIDYMIKAGKPGSDIVLVGTFKEPPAVDFFWMSRKEQRVYPSWTYRIADCASALDLLSRSGPAYSKLISHEFPLDKAAEAMELVMKGETSLKVVLTIRS